MSAPVVAVVGRANVGKSTLVNRILGSREAIEHPTPGVTRDRRGYPAQWAGSDFTLVDTGGWEPKATGLAAKVVAQAQRAAAEADLILFVVDTQTGVTADDLQVARTLRKATVPVVLVANKVDETVHELDASELYRLGFGEPFPVSALHGRGSGDLLDVIVAHLRDLGPDRAPDPAAGAVSVALAGRPNAGKSSLLNRLAGDERSIVDEIPGTTRDTVDTLVEIEGARYRFVDTAGIRRKVKRAKGPEYYSLVRSLRAIDESDVVLHVVDIEEGVTEQDQKIAQRVAESGRAAVIVLNKWDLVPGEEAEDAAKEAAARLHFVSWAPLIRISALTSRGIKRIGPAIDRSYASWTARVPTAELNAWLRDGIDAVPLGRNRQARPVRIRYATQASVMPPEFILFTNGDIAPGPLRGIERRLRDRFGFEGSPLRLTVRRRQPEP